MGKIEPFKYSSSEVPSGYVCQSCGASGVKLWREYNTFLSHQTLECCDCAGKSQKKDVSSIDSDGRIALDPELHGANMRHDSIGWSVPAVPTEDGETFWGYMAVPEAGVQWWRQLPNRVAP